MSDRHLELRDFYENEAQLGTRRSLRSRRVELNERFIEALRLEDRASVIDFGSGPGLDGIAFAAAGVRFVGIDLAHTNGVLARRNGVEVIQGSVTDLPIRSQSFDAGWSLSVLMHLDNDAAFLALDQMAMVLRKDAPLVVGLWGSELEDLAVDDTKIPGSRRPFHLRCFENNRRLLTRRFTLEGAETWESTSEDWDYQVFWLRR